MVDAGVAVVKALEVDTLELAEETLLLLAPELVELEEATDDLPTQLVSAEGKINTGLHSEVC